MILFDDDDDDVNCSFVLPQQSCVQVEWKITQGKNVISSVSFLAEFFFG